MANRVQSTGGDAAVAASIELEVKNDTGNSLPVTIPVGASTVAKAEDAASVTADVGVMVLAKRVDAAAAQTDTAGDYTTPVANSFGALLMNVDSTYQQAAATGLLKLEDAASANGDAGVMMLAKRTDTAPAATSSDNGDYEPLQTLAGALWVAPLGDVADNAAQVNLKPVYVGAKAVVHSTYAPAYTAADSAGLAIDTVTGALIVMSKETPDATANFCPSQDVSGALEASSVSKASAGVFYGLSGHNTLGSAQWILVYNSATVPANGAVTPIAVIRVAASSPFSFDTGKFGIYCSAGISWSNSTDATIFNKTLGAADCFVNVAFI